MIRRIIVTLSFLFLFLVNSIGQEDSTRHYHAFYFAPTYNNCIEANDTFIGKPGFALGLNFISNYSKGWGTEWGIEFSQINFRTEKYLHIISPGGTGGHGTYPSTYGLVYNIYRIPFFEIPFLLRKQWQKKSRIVFISLGPEFSVGSARYKVTTGVNWGKYLYEGAYGPFGILGFQTRVGCMKSINKKVRFRFALFGNMHTIYLGGPNELKNKSYYSVGLQFDFLFDPKFQNNFDK